MVDQKVRPFLMFQGKAEEAMTFYVSHLPRSRMIDIVRYGSNEAGPEGSVKKATFSIDGQMLMCTDSVVQHGFGFTPALSLFVDCDSEDDIGRLATVLSEGGAVHMPLGNYAFSRKFAWVNDRYGVSWQLNLP